MFESVKELLSARETLETVQEQIAESEAKLQELQEQLKAQQESLGTPGMANWMAAQSFSSVTALSRDSGLNFSLT